MKAPPAAAAVLFLILPLTWLSVRAVNPDAEFFDRVLGELDHCATLDAGLLRDVITARSGMLRNYDPIVQKEDSMSAYNQRRQ